MPDNQSEISEYQVLARKYRPGRFDELIGQDAVVRTLRNAITANRLAHAYLFTGVRGVGKTTTARLLARALNCVGKDGKGGITDTPCRECESCTAIAESRHVDVLEMDAASRTGVDDIREIIDSVRYAPASARFKIYIIDEVHMLSKNAFNALLKTLEEPPPHVKFLFATTEVRKLPVTVLSRCQRFDLKRVDSDKLLGHLEDILKKENREADTGALKYIARAAEGSVRDALSLLDQALAHSPGKVEEEELRRMLGYADRAQTLELFSEVADGDAKDALKRFSALYEYGSDPVVVLRDLLEVAHWVTRVKIVADAGSDALVSEAERDAGKALAEKLTLAELSRIWQMLLKGIEETLRAPDPFAAGEMVLIRLCYAAGVPTPAEIARELHRQEDSGQADESHDRNDADTGSSKSEAIASEAPKPRTARASEGTQPTAQVLALDERQAPEDGRAPMPPDFRRLVELFEVKREGILGKHLRDDIRLVRYRPGLLEYAPAGRIPIDFSARLRACLEDWVGGTWSIAVTREKGEPTLKEQEADARERERREVLQDPLVKRVLEKFADAEIVDIRPIGKGAERQ